MRNEIFIEYTNTTKYIRVWAPQTHQVLIANKPTINLEKPLQELASESKLQGWLWKNAAKKKVMSDRMISNLTKRVRLDNDKKEYDESWKIQIKVSLIMTQSRMRVKIPHDSKELKSN